jgi:hypothetical protein
MSNQPTESIINEALIGLSRSFLQYVAESWPWVDETDRTIEEQMQVLAERQRQDVSDLVQLLLARDWSIDFGTFPTEYTDLHFISLSTLFERLENGQQKIAGRLAATKQALGEVSDEEATALVDAIILRQSDLAAGLKKLQQELADSITQA